MPNITIRSVQVDDASFVQRYASDSELAATCNVPHPYPSDGGVAFALRSVAAWQSRYRFPFSILSDGKFCGIVALNLPDLAKKTIEVDYWVARPFWGTGVATKAVALVIDYAFNNLGIEIIFSGCLEKNPASGRVLEKNGFQEIEPIINDGKYGHKFIGEKIRRLKLNKKNEPNVKGCSGGEARALRLHP